MTEFATVWDDAGASAEQAAADKSMAIAKQASAGIKGFLFQAGDESDFGHRIALAEDDLIKAAGSSGISVHALVAEHTREFGLLMEARRSVAGKPPTSDADHKVLDNAWHKSFKDLKDAGLEADADHPVAKAYRDASDAVNHANRSRDYGIATGTIPSRSAGYDFDDHDDRAEAEEEADARYSRSEENAKVKRPAPGGKTSAKASPCPDCNGARSVPAQGHEPYHEVSNGHVRCPTCAGHGVVHDAPEDSDDAPEDSDDRTSHERWGDSGDYYAGGDAGDAQDRHYDGDYYGGGRYGHLASIKQALEEGQDPLEWLEQQAQGEGQAEKPSEAGIEAIQGKRAAVPPFSREAASGYYDRENLSPGETDDLPKGTTHIDESGPHPRVHTFGSTGEAYNASQYHDAIKDGDVLHVPSEGVTGFLQDAWPVALHHNGDPGEFHGMNPEAGEDIHSLFGGGAKGQQYGLKDYSDSLAKAKEVHQGTHKQGSMPPF